MVHEDEQWGGDDYLEKDFEDDSEDNYLGNLLEDAIKKTEEAPIGAIYFGDPSGVAQISRIIIENQIVIMKSLKALLENDSD